MLAKLNTFALVGIDAAPVEAEVDVSADLPKTVLVGSVTPVGTNPVCLVLTAWSKQQWEKRHE